MPGGKGLLSPKRLYLWRMNSFQRFVAIDLQKNDLLMAVKAAGVGRKFTGRVYYGRIQYAGVQTRCSAMASPANGQGVYTSQTPRSIVTFLSCKTSYLT